MGSSTSIAMVKNNELVVFEGQPVRREWYKDEYYKDEYYYSIVDVVSILTKSKRPRKYWSDLKLKLKNEEDFEVSDRIGQLRLKAPNGKLRETDCTDTETMFRIIQSIPSKNANKFKLWLARMGYERIKEIENPELAQNRVREYYQLKGYPEEWIEKRIRGIAIRQELTGEWKNREIKEGKEFAILTDSKGLDECEGVAKRKKELG